jgi:hypothetical protein
MEYVIGCLLVFLVISEFYARFFLSKLENVNLRVTEKGMLWRIFEPKKEELTGGWIKLLIRTFVIVVTLHQADPKLMKLR